VARQRAVRLVAVARRSAGLHAEPWLDVAAREPHGTLVRRVAPWPEAPQDEPSRAAPLGGPSQVVVPLDGPWQVVLLDGPLAQPRLLGPGLLVGRTSRCSPQSRRHQEKMLQRERMAKA
jgi:hypothetical protein